MALTPIEIIAAIFAAIGVIKILVIIVNKDAWYNTVAKPIYNKPQITGFIFILAAIAIFYYLIQELSIVQIMASVAFTAFLVGFSFCLYSKELQSLVKKIYAKKINTWLWLYMIVWLALSFWALYEIFLA